MVWKLRRDIQVAALDAGEVRRGVRGLLDRLEQRVALAGRLAGAITLAEFPDHHTPQAEVAGVADFRLAGVLLS